MTSTLQANSYYDNSPFDTAPFCRQAVSNRSYNAETVFSGVGFGNKIWQPGPQNDYAMARNPGLRPGVNGHPNLSLVLPSTQSSHQSFGPPGEGRSPVTSETTGVRHTEPSSAQSRSQNESAVLTPTSATNQSETNSQVIFGLRDSQVQHHSGLGPPGFSERASAWSSVKEFQPTFSSSQSRTIGNSRLDVSRKPFVSLATPKSQAISTHRDLQTIWKEHERRAKQAQIYAQDDYRPSLPTILPSVEANSRGHQLDGEQFRSPAAIGELENMFQNLGNDTEHRDHSYRRGSASWAIHSRCSTVRSTGPRERRECDENAREEWGRNPHHHYQPFLSPNVAPGQHCYDTINHHHSSTLPNVSTHLDGNPTRAMLSYDASLVEPGIGNTRRTRQIYADFTRHDGHIFGQNTCGNGMYGPDVAVRTDPRQAGCTFQSGLTAPFTICDPQIDRQHEPTQIVRSQLLEEFRMNGKTKKYELRDIYDHIVEFSGDQLGSRFIQNKLEIANSDEKDRVFQEIATDSRQLMTDVFGNYVIQKMFEHGDQSQKKVLASHMKGHVYALSTQTYGCRVVQKALEHILTDQQASLIKELDGRVLSVVENQNGNHVIQKAIERIPGEHIQFIVNAHLGHVHYLSKHSYGCRVIQRMLEHCSPHAKRQILDELHADIGDLIQDAFGNYVVQHVIVNGEAQDRKPVIDKVQSRLLENAMHKFASNVVEKAIDYAQEDQRHAMVRKLTGRDEHGQSQVIKLLSHQYGNYVIQKCAAHLNGQTLQSLVEEMEQYLMQLRRVSTGKQVTALESSIRDARQRLHNQRQEDPLHHVAFRPKSSTMRR